MNHPFALNSAELEVIDLDFAETLTDAQQAPIGGLTATTLALGEEGGDDVTTLALGEEGGGEIVCISAPCPGSEGGDSLPKPIPIDPHPPITKALYEGGGSPSQPCFEVHSIPGW